MHPTVLIVDDNTVLAYFTAYNIRQEMEGLNVLTAASCKEALTIADKHKPSLVIVDLKLPDGDGLELIEKLKSCVPGTVAILVTATPLPVGFHKDVFGLLLKPYGIDQLVDLVRSGLELNGRIEDGEPVNRHLEKTPLPPAQPDLHHVQNRLSAFLVAIRALRLELNSVADNPDEVRRIVDEYSDRLTAMVKDAAETLKRRA